MDFVEVDLGRGIIELMDKSKLVQNNSVVDNDHEHTEVTEYLLNGKVVHRSVHVTLKKGIGIEGIFGKIG